MAVHCPDSLSAVVALFQSMTPAKLERLGDLYSPGVSYADPVHEAGGLNELREVLGKRVAGGAKVEFRVEDAHGDEVTGFLLWTRRDGGGGEIRGTSHFRFARDGRIAEQRDHWDPTAELYGRVPVVGWLMRVILKRARGGALRRDQPMVAEPK